MDNIRKSFIVVAVLTFLYGLYYWGIPSVINIEQRIDFVEQKIKESSGYNIAIEKPYLKMGLTPAIWLMAEDFSLLNDDNSNALNLKHAAVKINLLPLIFGKVQIGNFSADKITVNFVYTKDSELRLGQYLLPKLSDPKMTLSKAYFRIGNYEIYLKDLKQNKQIFLDGSYFNLDEFKRNKRIKLSTFANLWVDKKNSQIMADVDIKLPINKITEDQFKINGRIVDLNLGDFSVYVQAVTNNKIQSLSGIINLLTETTTKSDKHKNIFAILTVDNLKIMKAELARSIYCNEKIEIRTDVDTIKNGLNIRNMKILSKGINISLFGKIMKLDAKIPFVNINIAINKSRTENFIPLLPGEENLIEEVNFYALKKNYFYGDISGNISVKGKFNAPDVNGKILVKEGYLIKPLPNKAGKAVIKLAFNGTKMIMDVNVPASDKETVWVNGNVELYGNKYADLYIKSSQNVDLKIAQIVLNPLHEILKFDIGPVPIMDIKGKGNISLHIIGNRKDPHAWGNFNFFDTSASFLDIKNMTLTKGQGKLLFDDQKTFFKTQKAFLNNKPIDVEGTCTLKGLLDFKISAKNQDLGNLLKIIKTSPMLVDIQKLVKPITSANGLTGMLLNVTGNITDVNNVVFNKNIFAKGEIDLFSNTIIAQDIPLTNVNGKIKFDNLNTTFDLKSNLKNSLLKVNGRMDDKMADIKILSDKFVLKDAIESFKLKVPYKDDIGRIHTSFNARYSGNIDKIEPDKISVKGKIYQSTGKNISNNNVEFELNNSNFHMSELKGKFKNSLYFINMRASKFLSAQQSINGSFGINDFSLSDLNELKSVFPEIFGLVNNLNGKINISGYIENNEIYADTVLNNVSFIYIPANLKSQILNGKVQLRKNNIIINNLNTLIGEMPFFVNGKVYNFNSKPILNVYLNAKPTQEFLDQFFNNRAVYPIKIKGDINLTSTLSGPLTAIRNKTQLKLSENSSIYYMGATLGSVTANSSQSSYPVNITVDNILYPNGVKINNFQYDKLLYSQNGKIYPKTQLSASGNIGFLKNNDLKFTNFKVKTQEATDAKIFNIIFRKPLMKQGLFTSDITINGKASAPVVFGKLNINNIDVPLFDAIIKDINFDFKRDMVYLKAKGAVLTNNLDIRAVMRNNPNQPLVFEDINVNLENLDLNRINTALRDYDADVSRNLTTSQQDELFNFDNIIIKKSEISADNIKIKNLNATDFYANLTIDNKMLVDVNKYKFNVADGIVTGNIKYNLLSNALNFEMNVENANAQSIAETLFDLKGQIFGIITGNVNLYCNGKSQDDCTKSLGGNGHFIVEQGRMPKLGSLEYLLKAGNLVKGGITGLSINGIIDLITPYKTGDFDSISGNFHIENGIADNIQIFSAGKDLNMYMKGSYNFTNLIADLQIFGALTKNFSTLFGKIGNASLNTLFNTIPGINVSEAPSVITEDIKKIPNSIQNTARVFTVEVYGDINGDDYVRSFKWVK